MNVIIFCQIFVFQNVTPESFSTHPIIFGDFIKVGADKVDRLYEEMPNLDKVKTILGDVSTVEPLLWGHPLLH